MVGEVSGYYEPEWSERTAYEQLREAVLFSARQRSMSDAEWAEAMGVTGVTAEDQKRIDEWVNASDPDCGAYAQPASSTPSTPNGDARS